MRKLLPGGALVIGLVVSIYELSGVAQGGGVGLFLNEGWESGSLAGSFNSSSLGRTADSPQFGLDRNVPGTSGVWALRHSLPAGTPVDGIHAATQHFGDSPRTPVWPTGAGQHFHNLYMQYKFYYSPGFNFGSGHYKQFIIGTQDNRASHTETCCFPPAAHYIATIVERGGVLQAEGYNKQPGGSHRYDINPNAGGYSDANPYRIQTGQWYTLELRIGLNDAGVDNGIFQMWMNGALIADHRNVRFRVPLNGAYGTNFTYGTNFAQLNNYSTNAVPQNQQIYYDDLRFSTAPIGATASNLPSPPTNLRLVPGS